MKFLLINIINFVLITTSNTLWESVETMEEQTEEILTFINIIRSNCIGIKTLIFLCDLEDDNYFVHNIIDEFPFKSIEVTSNQTGAILFNGKYDCSYPFDDFITFEESKLYIYQDNGFESFTNAMSTMQRLYFFRSRDKLLLVMNHNSHHETVKMVDHLITYKIVNVIFVYTNGSVFTFDVIKHEKWLEIQDNNYFYNKFIDFEQQKISISMFHHVRDAIPRSHVGDGYTGRDGLLASEFLRWINAVGEYIKPTDGITYGENRGNKNITGVFGDVARNISDVALNSRLMKPEFENIVEYSYPHGRDDLVVLVPCGNADVTIEYYKSFEDCVWLCIFFFNVFCIIVFIKTDAFDRASTAVLYTWGIFFGQAYSSSKTTIGKTLVFLYTIYSFLILVHYSSLLVSIITVPHKPQEIDTFEELAESGLRMYTVERYKRYLELYGEQSIKRLKDRIFIVGEKNLTKLTNEHGHYAIINKRSVAEWAVLSRMNYKNGHMIHRIMKKSPFPAIICFIVRYGSPLKLSLNKYMTGIVESGIQDYWMGTTLSKIFAEENKYYHEVNSDVEKKIAVDELIPIFAIYCVGVILAGLVFIWEVYSVWKEKKKRKLEQSIY